MRQLRIFSETIFSEVSISTIFLAQGCRTNAQSIELQLLKAKKVNRAGPAKLLAGLNLLLRASFKTMG